jgi:hypothetical protein
VKLLQISILYLSVYHYIHAYEYLPAPKSLFLACGGIKLMSKYALTSEDLAYIKSMCEVSEKIGFNWTKAIQLFPATTKEEVLWKEKMLAGIQSCGKLKDVQVCAESNFCSNRILQPQPCPYVSSENASLKTG